MFNGFKQGKLSLSRKFVIAYLFVNELITFNSDDAMKRRDTVFAGDEIAIDDVQFQFTVD